MIKIIKTQDGRIINLNNVGLLEIIKPYKQFNYYTIEAYLMNDSKISIFQCTGSEEDLVNKVFEWIIDFWKSESWHVLDIIKDIHC